MNVYYLFTKMMFNKSILTDDISLVLIDLIKIAVAPATKMLGCQRSLGFEDVNIFKDE